jgi:FeS assembly SUF system protein
MSEPIDANPTSTAAAPSLAPPPTAAATADTAPALLPTQTALPIPTTPAPGPAAVGRTPEQVRDAVIAQLHTVYDPEIPVDIYELGLVYQVSVEEDGRTSIQMTLTSPSCPAAEELPPEVETKARSVAGVTSVALDLVWEPVWTPDRMSEAAKLELGML